MIATTCTHENRKKNGKNKCGNQRFRCKDCGVQFVDTSSRPLGAMRTDIDKGVLALNLLLEGMSISATSRMTGLKADTICNLVLTVGENCERLMRSKIVDVEVQDVEVDEIWSYVGMKERTRKRLNRDEQYGDSWTFIAIERNTKLVLSYHIGNRDGDSTKRFLNKLRKAVTGRFQLTSDGFPGYTYNVPFAFRHDVDYGRLVKVYQSSQQETRYSPATIISAEKSASFGSPDPERISTSMVERLNLTLRMQMRRFTRLTNGYSKSLAHHKAMQSVFFAWYNFVRKHQTLKTTPAVESGITEKPWSMKRLLEEAAKVE